jgi:hypothetical protein
LNSIYSHAETAANSLLYLCNKATAAYANFKNALARLQVSTSKCSDVIQAVDIVYVVILADYAYKRSVKLSSRVVDNHSNSGRDRGYLLISIEEEQLKRETYNRK